MFLYETYDVLANNNTFQMSIPEYITCNLRYPLRPYQLEALKRYLYYKNDTVNREFPEHILYNMATGSGKTLLMAALLLEKYYQGERNFLFFVNNDNILTKTRSNFLESGSSKYLFADKIVINGLNVEVREVNDFSASTDNAINIVFTTIQKLHQDLNTPRENRLSYEQFEDLSIVLLADEAHHLNAGLSRSEEKDNKSWTATIEAIQKSARKSSLFEFTATIDLNDKSIAQKYENHLLYRYDLKRFRLDKYSKDVLFHLVDSDTNNRILQGIIISQYRKKVALKNGLNIKPLVMFKSKTINENQENLNSFLEMLDNLSEDNLKIQRNMATDGILKNAFDFFDSQNISDTSLITELQEDFRAERLLLIDGRHKNSDCLNAVNTLENPDNEIRAIFAVDMLNEGWDVLNLFDIVRLYDTRDGRVTRNGFVPGSTTNTEKQLIGRGARYYPFVIADYMDEMYTRKFDNNEHNELRVLEQLHYHSVNNPKYISELKQVLTESGIYDQTQIERELHLKEAFKQTRIYTKGVVWMNKRISQKETWNKENESLFDKSFIPKSFEVSLPVQSANDFYAFDSIVVPKVAEGLSTNTYKYKKVITKHVTRAAMNRNKAYTFSNLIKAIPGIQSVDNFIDMLDNIELIITADQESSYKFSQDQKLYIAERLLQSIENNIIESEDRYYGTDKFEAYPLKDVFDDKILRKYIINQSSHAEVGKSQKTASETDYFEDLDNLQWYAYDDNFGTSEEKLLVKTIKELMSELENKWTDIYLLRNEKAVRIYNFSDGQAFEPDFLMFANDKALGNVSWQIFIEPKGSQFCDGQGTFLNGKEGWKEKFLLEISQRDNAKTLVDNDRYRIIGLPFYNKALTEGAIKETLRDLK